MLVQVTGGTYLDEATNQRVALSGTLRAALTNVTGTVSVAVTPLTELAVLQAGLPLTGDRINRGNATVNSLFGLNITGTMPSDVTQPDLLTATQSELDYGLFLAALSQLSQQTGRSIPELLAQISADLSDNATLDATGGQLLTALETYLINANNQTGIGSTDQSGLKNPIKYFTENPVLVPATEISDIWKAKALVSEFRETVLTLNNYTGIGAPGILDTPARRLTAEINQELVPELSAALDRLAWVVQWAMLLPGPGNYVFTDYPPYTLQINYGDTGAIDFTISQDSVVLDSGLLTVEGEAAPIPGLSTLPAGGLVQASFQTPNGRLTINGGYQFTIALDASITLAVNGIIAAPGLDVDLSAAAGRGVTLYLSPTADQTSVLPTRLIFNGRAESRTTLMDGYLDVMLVENTSTDSGETQVLYLPSSFNLNGSFTELNGGRSTGTVFTGTSAGTWSNAAAFNTLLPVSATNYPIFDATFNGQVAAEDRPTVTAFLRARETAASLIRFDANYRRRNTDGREVFLSGSGTLNYETRILLGTFTNQDGLEAEINLDLTQPLLAGSINAAGGEKLADISLVGAIPTVTYLDGYSEPILPGLGIPIQ
ncbi:MAG: hypothetical protein BWY73_00629 [candidate division TA06 bacterium ADurb.Bin417]|uniref:Uncharacterized protein n=1 Tax=candidate division TA06 bacterium ADurb.Bin417 TaxID=1852828 RepID=A0A1V5MIP7_UNCT6|nr:MAG: hypothetical protein BWY73_00629 [candidate division TA06 bacterium ADurb.Bin417]